MSARLSVGCSPLCPSLQCTFLWLQPVPLSVCPLLSVRPVLGMGFDRCQCSCTSANLTADSESCHLHCFGSFTSATVSFCGQPQTGWALRLGQIPGQCPGFWRSSSISLQLCAVDFGSLVHTLQTSAPTWPGALVIMGPLACICFAGMGSCVMFWKNLSINLSIVENQSSVFQDRTAC